MFVSFQIDTGHRRQRRRGFVVHVVQQEVCEERVLGDLMYQPVAEVAHGLVAGVQQPQLHQLVRHHVRDHLDTDVFKRRPASREIVLQRPLGEWFADDRPGVHPNRSLI